VSVVVNKDAGYSAGDVVRVTNGIDAYKSTQKNSCPAGYKLWAPPTKADWTIVYNALGKNLHNYPRVPHLIIDVTNPENKCGGCTKYAMKSGVPQQSSWKTTDGNLWWMRDSRYNEPNGNYNANCYLYIYDVNPENVRFDDGSCAYHSRDYLCQPVQSGHLVTVETSSFPLKGPIKGSLMRVATPKPQVVLRTNDVLAACTDSDVCNFVYSKDSTPVLDSVTPNSGPSGQQITVKMSAAFKAAWVDVSKISISVGGVGCADVKAGSDKGTFTCKVGQTPAGTYPIDFIVAGVGRAFTKATFKSLLKVTKVTPVQGSLMGGTILTIEGTGFSSMGPDNTITVGGVQCRPRVVDNCHCAGLKYEGRVNCHTERVYGYASAFKRHYAKHFDFSNYARIECVVVSGHTAGKVDVTVKMGSEVAKLAQSYTFSEAMTPVVDMVSPNPVAPSVAIKLKGKKLKALPVTDKQYYMNIWGFYDKFPSVSVYFGEIDPSMIFGYTLCFIGDVTTEDTMGKHQDWSGATDSQITCTVADIRDGPYDVHVYVHGKGFPE
jgi:hypothetical protein